MNVRQRIRPIDLGKRLNPLNIKEGRVTLELIDEKTGLSKKVYDHNRRICKKMCRYCRRCFGVYCYRSFVYLHCAAYICKQPGSGDFCPGEDRQERQAFPDV